MDRHRLHLIGTCLLAAALFVAAFVVSAIFPSPWRRAQG
jgi:hypothetical protein